MNQSEEINEIPWETLMAEWIQGKQPIDSFLASKGIDASSLAAKQATSHWMKQVETAKSNLRVLPGRGEVDLDEELKDIWDNINKWRKKQVLDDYKTADAVRLHCKILLNQNLDKWTNPNSGKEEVTTKLNTSQLKSIASTLESVQKIQRLALGLSTENIGVESNLDSERQ